MFPYWLPTSSPASALTRYTFCIFFSLVYFPLICPAFMPNGIMRRKTKSLSGSVFMVVLFNFFDVFNTCKHFFKEGYTCLQVSYHCMDNLFVFALINKLTGMFIIIFLQLFHLYKSVPYNHFSFGSFFLFHFCQLFFYNRG